MSKDKNNEIKETLTNGDITNDERKVRLSDMYNDKDINPNLHSVSYEKFVYNTINEVFNIIGETDADLKQAEELFDIQRFNSVRTVKDTDVYNGYEIMFRGARYKSDGVNTEGFQSEIPNVVESAIMGKTICGTHRQALPIVQEQGLMYGQLWDMAVEFKKAVVREYNYNLKIRMAALLDEAVINSEETSYFKVKDGTNVSLEIIDQAISEFWKNTDKKNGEIIVNRELFTTLSHLGSEKHILFEKDSQLTKDYQQQAGYLSGVKVIVLDGLPSDKLIAYFVDGEALQYAINPNTDWYRTIEHGKNMGSRLLMGKDFGFDYYPHARISRFDFGEYKSSFEKGILVEADVKKIK